jgi:hypothetical protein
MKVKLHLPLVEQELLTLLVHLSSSPVYSGVRVTRSLVLCVIFCRSLFVLLYFFFWPFCCLFFDIWILITPLVFNFGSQRNLILISTCRTVIIMDSFIYAALHYGYNVSMTFWLVNISKPNIVIFSKNIAISWNVCWL